MDLVTLTGIAVGLSMDAFAVAIASGCSTKDVKLRQALRMALFFGVFQAVMPVIGWFAGLTFRGLISSFDHWVAFGLLALVGGKMIVEFFQGDKACEEKTCPMDIPNLFILAVATSIDALAIGLSLSLLNTPIAFPATFIGVVTFVISFAGVYIGKRFGDYLENKMELVGGIVLIAIGVKVLLEHLLK